MPRPPGEAAGDASDRDAPRDDDAGTPPARYEFGLTSAFRRSSGGGLAALTAALKKAAPGARRSVHIHVTAGDPIGWPDLVVADAPPEPARPRCLRVSGARPGSSGAPQRGARACRAAPPRAPRRPQSAPLPRRAPRHRPAPIPSPRAAAAAVGGTGAPLRDAAAVPRAAGLRHGQRRARRAAAGLARAARGQRARHANGARFQAAAAGASPSCRLSKSVWGAGKQARGGEDSRPPTPPA
jgi:hypothetical protein